MTRVFAITVLLLAPAAYAHHSFAMFDRTKLVTLTGTIKEVQWTNPHVWIQIVVPAGNNSSEEWSIEGNSPNGLIHSGFHRDTLKPGDRVVIKANPLKNGDKGGSLIEIDHTDGTPILTPPKPPA